MGNEPKVHNRSMTKSSDLSTSLRHTVHLPHLTAFEVAARHLNFARAAQELEITPTAMSKTIKQLESQIGTRLFNRTTRSVALTEVGAMLVASLVPALAQIKQSVEEARVTSARPSGLLRVNTSYVAWAALIEPHVQGFLDRFNEVGLDVQIDNGLSDIVANGFDAGIRLGHAVQRDMIAIPLGPLQQLVVVGSPGYFRKRGVPKVPKDLIDHECIRQRLGQDGRILSWSFSVAGKAIDVQVQGRLRFNEMRPALTAACEGAGLAYVFRQFAAQEIRSGKLEVALERYSKPLESFHLYYPNRAQMPGKLRAFIDYVRAVNWEVPI
jgi:DNA-binding transcriptional LysR family regulator